MNENIIRGFLLEKKLGGVKASTLANYSYKLNSSIVPCFIKGLATSEDDLFYTLSQKQEHLENKTYFDLVVLINDFLNYLYHKKYIKDLIKVPCPKIKKKRLVILTLKEKQMLETYLIKNMNYFNFGILFSLYTGIRIGELSACKNLSIQDNGILNITKTLQRIKNLDKGAKTKTKIVIDDPKSECSIREIPIPNFVLKLYKQLPRLKDDCFLITNTNKYIEPRTIERKFDKILKDCGIAAKKFHILRHTFATDRVKEGMEIKSLSEILGHSSVKITLDYYIHSDLQSKIKSMQKIKPTTKSLQV